MKKTVPTFGGSTFDQSKSVENSKYTDDRILYDSVFCSIAVDRCHANARSCIIISSKNARKVFCVEQSLGSVTNSPCIHRTWMDGGYGFQSIMILMERIRHTKPLQSFSACTFLIRFSYSERSSVIPKYVRQSTCLLSTSLEWVLI